MNVKKSFVIALAMVAGAGVQAATQAQLSLSGFSYTLKDLNLADGLAPALSFTGIAGRNLDVSEAKQLGWTVGSIPVPNSHMVVYGPEESLSDFAWSGVGTLSSTRQQALASVAAQAENAPELEVQSNVDAGNKAAASASYFQWIVLGAGTQATFRMLVNASISGDEAIGSMPNGQFGPHSNAGVSAMLIAGPLQATTGMTSFNGFSIDSEAYEQTIDGQWLTLTIKNTSNAEKSLPLSVNASVWASDHVAPVPEPASYALMALGLIGVAAASRRRQQR
ncbi:PEP-CTERM sorting domain-containing protein [Paucibacter sp. APW11]|uniref:PEP-CTERM sorting domain-containing protein n=1 Tax=Roseateles aquae TaxID=3077235 RepID=A0ABU3PEX1_9BURK|nr:PEP-CTERM sorting domain-containing protein [Paucibacter sp. APW11]MDT9001106.1 PEP-CTERM sorting domain-containing protein [Paucibacter sp. APW11]